jgi:hypothetical protein
VSPAERVWLVLTVLAARWEAEDSEGLMHLAVLDARDELVRRGLAVAPQDADLWPSRVASSEPSS